MLEGRWGCQNQACLLARGSHGVVSAAVDLALETALLFCLHALCCRSAVPHQVVRQSKASLAPCDFIVIGYRRQKMEGSRYF